MDRERERSGRRERKKGNGGKGRERKETEADRLNERKTYRQREKRIGERVKKGWREEQRGEIYRFSGHSSGISVQCIPSFLLTGRTS